MLETVRALRILTDECVDRRLSHALTGHYSTFR